MRRESGFTLLEAIVAITLFATLSLSLYSWINSMMLGVARFQALAEESTSLENAVDYLSTVNPMDTPSGSQRIGSTLLSWESELVEPIKRGNMTRAFDLGLYELNVVLQRSGEPDQRLTLRQVGYRLRDAEGRQIGI